MVLKKTRFAPSPTGELHLGNARTALISYFYIKSLGGEFILRIDDTDTERVKPEYIEGIFQDLNWLGIEWQLTFKQSERKKRYDSVLQKLIEKKRVYPCYETAEELEFKRKSLMKQNLPPVYDRASLNRKASSKAETIANEIQLEKPYYRFLIDHEDVISWEDKLRGKITINLKSTSDPIVLRANGFYTYMLPSVIDDIDYGINTIIRGEDHISNTAIQLQMLKAVREVEDEFEDHSLKDLPEFIHLPLLKINEGKISKRSGGYSIKSFREEDIEAQTIVGYLVNLGNKQPIDFFQNTNQYISKNINKNIINKINSSNNFNISVLSDIFNSFNIKNYSSAAISVNCNDIFMLNHKYISSSNFAVFKDNLPSYINESFWETVKHNIRTKSEATKLWHSYNEENFLTNASNINSSNNSVNNINNISNILPNKAEAAEIKNNNSATSSNIDVNKVGNKIATENNCEASLDSNNIIIESVSSRATDKELLECAIAALPQEITLTSYKEWLENIRLKIKRDNKQLNMEIRLALTGLTKGPELAKLLPLLGRNSILNRLENSIKIVEAYSRQQ